MLPSDLVEKLNHCATTDFAGARDHWFNWLAGFTTMVAAGLVFEAPELVYELKAIARERIPYFRYRVITRPHREHAAKVIAFIGWILIVAGVGGERVAEVKVKDFDIRIQECSDAKVREATLESADAIERASQANQRASNNEKEAAQLRKDAAELEDSISWRKLTPTSRAKLQSDLDFAHLILGLSVRRTWLVYNNNDTEAFTFGMDLGAVLQSAKWNPTDPTPIEKMFIGPVPFGTNKLPRGVVVSSLGGKVEDDAANILVKAISALGFDCTKSPMPAIHEQNPSPTVFIFIDARPEGPQGEAKLRRAAEVNKKQAQSTHAAK